MRKRIKNILNTLTSVYNFLISIVYEGSRQKADSKKFDSRTIPPPRSSDDVERNLLQAISNDEGIVPHVLSYSNNFAHSSIYWFKYKRDKYTIRLLSRLLQDEILGMISDKLDKRHDIKNWIVTFAPSTSFHLGDKRWDHNKDIADELKRNTDFAFQEIFTLSNTAVKSSKKLNKFERKSLSSNKFLLLPNAKISEDSGLIIFDDVTTTGSTLISLRELAEKLKPKIILVVAIAH